MRRFTTLIFIGALLFSAPVYGQDEPKPFEQMTIEELHAVDTKSLTKNDKKAHKKALKAAKKAEKKRIKEEKKAERKRRRAEQKRLKREAKEREANNKEVRRQIKMVSDVYEETRILRDDFEAFIEIVGPKYPRKFAWLLVRDPVDFHFRAFFYPANQELQLRLVSSSELSVPEVTPANVDSLRGGPERYMTRNRYWHYYRRATLRGGVELEVEPLAKYLDKCNTLTCEFREDVGLTLTMDDLTEPLESQEFLQIKISGARGHEYLIGLSPGLIIGFLKKLAETGALDDNMQAVVNTAEITLHSRIQPDVADQAAQ